MEEGIDLWSREETPVITIELQARDAISNVGKSIEDDDRKKESTMPNRNMKLRQYVSDDTRWGIFSCVWDGGLALLAYLSFYGKNNNERQVKMGEDMELFPLVIDVGSGTGVVGIGAALIGYQSILTDLPEALPLLEENCDTNGMKCLHVMELSWGRDPLPSELEKLIFSADDEGRQVIIAGADIIYRQNLFDPLLITLRQLLKLQTKKPVQCILGSQSLRQHLYEFWTKARDEGFSVSLVANSYVPESSVQLPKITLASGEPGDGDRGAGVVNIVNISIV